MMRIIRRNFVAGFVFAGLVCITAQAQERPSELNTDCLSLKMIEQKPAPKSKEKPAPDVIVAVPDDLHIRFEFKNNCQQTIYYLAETISDDRRAPTGFFIYRNNQADWKARTPTWRREGSLTDPFLYYWLPLRPSEQIEFEFSDLTRIEGERSIAIYVNTSPCQDKRVELLAVPFRIKTP